MAASQHHRGMSRQGGQPCGETLVGAGSWLNQPMIDIMRSAGHLDGVRPWHIWHYRAVFRSRLLPGAVAVRPHDG
jgi:hypothetical protein